MPRRIGYHVIIIALYVITSMALSFQYPTLAAANVSINPTVILNDIPEYVNSLETIEGTAASDLNLDSVQIEITNRTDSTYWDGISWQAIYNNIVIVDSSGEVGSECSAAFDTKDNPAISYLDMTNRDLKYAYWDGSSWVIETVDSAGWVGHWTSLAFDLNGNPAISYFDDLNEDLKYAYWNGNSWAIEIVESSGNVGRDNSLAFNSDGNPAISYYHSNNTDLKYAQWNGSSWEIETVDYTDNIGASTSLAFDESDNPAISYYDLTNQDLKYAYWNGSSWDIQTVESIGTVGGSSSLVFDSSNNPAISYHDITGTALKYALGNGSSWEIQTVDSVGNVGQYSSLSFDSAGNPHIGYYDITNDDLKYTQWNGTSWTIQTIDSLGQTGFFSCLSIDSNDNPAISYYDATNRDLKFVWISDTEWVDAVGTTAWLYNMPTLADGSYDLRAKAYDDAGNISAFASDSFVYDSTPPSTPTALTRTTPDSDNTPTFTWASSTDATSGITSYQVKLGSDSWTEVSTATNYTFSSSLAGGSYIFHVRAKDGASHIGEAASVAFYIDAIPNRPTNTLPTDEATSVSLNPTLESSAFSDDETADTHTASQWQITAMSGQYSGPTWNSGSDATNLTDIEVPVGNLVKSTTYYWRVRHQDGHDNWSEWSEETSFITVVGGGGLCGGVVAVTPASLEDLISGWGILGLLCMVLILTSWHRNRRKQQKAQ
ncbi:hypothetical protein ACFLVP_04280 [Chloroflexota bacterium]